MRRSTPLFLVLALCAAVAPARADATTIRYDAMVAMSDGVHLDATLYVPAHPSAPRVPLIVRQHGGGSNKDSAFDVAYGLVGVERGDFALLMYSARGHGNSEGLFDFFGARTTKDFSDMLDWVASAHGDVVDTDNVGASGYSQGGGESLLPAEQDARVKALAVGNTFDDLNRALNPNDCYKASFATGIFAAAYTASATKVDETLPVRWGAQFYSDTEDVSPAPGVPSTTDDLHARSPLTGVQSLIDRRVPVFWSNGWEDQLFPGDMPAHILQPLEDAGVPVHYWFNSGGHGATDYLPEQQAREAAMLDWFDQFLRGVDHGFATRSKVDYWERTSGAARGPGTWEHHSAADWPVPSDRYTVGLGTAGGLDQTIVSPDPWPNVADDAVAGIAASNVPGGDAIVRGIPENGGKGSLAYDMRFPAGRVVGSPHVRIVASTTGGVLREFDAKVYDVGSSGATLIWRGCSTGPASAPDMSFDLWPNAHTIPAGDHVRIVISTSDAVVFEPNLVPSASAVTQVYLSLPFAS